MSEAITVSSRQGLADGAQNLAEHDAERDHPFTLGNIRFWLSGIARDQRRKGFQSFLCIAQDGNFGRMGPGEWRRDQYQCGSGFCR